MLLQAKKEAGQQDSNARTQGANKVKSKDCTCFLTGCELDLDKETFFLLKKQADNFPAKEDHHQGNGVSC